MTEHAIELEKWKSDNNRNEQHYFIKGGDNGYQHNTYLFGYNPDLLSEDFAHETLRLALDMLESEHYPLMNYSMPLITAEQIIAELQAELANEQANEMTREAALNKAISDLQALPAAGTPAKTITGVTVNFSDDSTQEIDVPTPVATDAPEEATAE